MTNLLHREDERGFFDVFYVSAPHLNGGTPGIYADVTYLRGDGPAEHPHGFNRRCSSYREAAHVVFREMGEWPEYADHL